MSESTVLSHLRYACLPLQIRTINVTESGVNVLVERTDNLWQFMLCNNLYVEFDLTNNKRSVPFICWTAQNISMTSSNNAPILLQFVPIIGPATDSKIRIEFDLTRNKQYFTQKLENKHLNYRGYLNTLVYYAETSVVNLTGIGIAHSSLYNKVVPNSSSYYTIFNNKNAFSGIYREDTEFMKACSAIYDNFMMPTFTVNFSFSIDQNVYTYNNTQLLGLFIQENQNSKKRLGLFTIMIKKVTNDSFNIIIDNFSGQNTQPLNILIPYRNNPKVQFPIINVIAIVGADKQIFVEWTDPSTLDKKVGYSKKSSMPLPPLKAAKDSRIQGNSNMIQWWTLPYERRKYNDPTMYLYTNGSLVQKINSFSLGYGDMITPFNNRNLHP
jgi:hypothetical protein